MSCKIHHKKIDEEFNCPKCPTPLESEQIEKDFRLDMYIEARQEADSKDDMDIKEIMVFKRAIKNFLQNCNEDMIEDRMNELTSKTVKVDYNIDDANWFIAMSKIIVE